MEDNIYYKKVFIKNASDLPKEEGYYFCGIKTDLQDVWGKGEIGSVEHFPLNDDEIKQDWLKNIIWYLRPIEQKELDVPSEDEIENIYEVDDFDKYRKQGARWAIAEIKRRNE